MSPLQAMKELYAILDARTRRQVYFVSVLVMLAGLLEGIGVSIVIPFLKIVTAPESARDMPVLGDLIGDLAVSPGPNLILLFGIGMFTFIALKNCLLIVVYYIQNRIVFGNERRMATRLFSHYLNSPFIDVASRNSAGLIRNINNAIDSCFKGVLLGFIEIFTEICIVVSIGTILLITAPFAAILTVSVLGLSVVLYQFLIRRRFVQWGQSEHLTQQSMYHALQQGLHSLKTTKAHGREAALIETFDVAKERLYLVGSILSTANQTPRLWVETMIVLAMVIAIAVLLHTAPTTNDIVPILGLFAAAAFRLMPSINRTLMSINRIRHGTAALETVIGDMKITVGEDGPVPADMAASRVPFERLTFRDVELTYPGAARPAVSDLNLEIEQGQLIGLVGPSGAGKTTAVDLMLGLLAPTRGEITFNGQPLARMLREWRSNIGYVPQSVYIFDDTVRRNIAFGFKDDDIEEEAIWAAIDKAQLREFVEGLPDGLESNLGEHGLRMSGGQQQRLGLARALYHDPDILILDEATSALDLATEREVWQSISPLVHDKTVIVISHRLSTVQTADQIYVIDSGRIAEHGSFAELMKADGHFAKLCKLQESG